MNLRTVREIKTKRQKRALLLSYLYTSDQLWLCIDFNSSYVTFRNSNIQLSHSKGPARGDVFRVNKTKWPNHSIIIQIIQSTRHPEKWQHFTCSQSHVPECPSVSLNYGWAIKFLFTLNVLHFLIMRHWSISSSEIRFLISCEQCAK